MKGEYYYSLLVLVCTCNSLAEAVVLGPDSWAVLVAGAEGYGNYAMQADICHAYHVLLNKGVPKDRIITMMVDDIANDEENPNKGTVINKPGGEDVYEGVEIDYRGKDVTPTNFLNILLGKEEEMANIGTGKVLKSGKDDIVFINFSGHGSNGLVVFPDDYLYASAVIDTMHKMNNENKYGKLVWYIDSCNSGSMFDNLIEHFENVFASTASATDEPSWNTYCDFETMGTCLGGLYDTNWMERLDQIQESETLFENYDAVRTAVNRSHVQLYGDYKLGFIEEFMPNNIQTLQEKKFIFNNTVIPRRDVPLFIARMKALKAKDPNAKKDLRRVLKAREFADNLVSRIFDVFTKRNSALKRDLETNRYPLNLKMFECYKSVVAAFNENCFEIHKSKYFLKHLYKFSNICVKELNEKEAINAIRNVCQEKAIQIKKVAVAV